MALLITTKFASHFSILVLLGRIISANGIQSGNGARKGSVYLPPIIISCLTPLSPSATTRWAKDLSQEKNIENVSSLCSEGGLICNESLKTPSSNLQKFSTYRLPNIEDNLQYNNMFFKETLLFPGSHIKFPIQEPQIPTRAFLPPLLEPYLFNHSTSLFLHVLQAFGFHFGTPLAHSMEHTLQTCNTPRAKGETKACVATFEDMLDFALSSIGTNDIMILASASLPHDQIFTVMDLYDVTWAGERVAVACHNAMFPFQVFYCHHIQGSKVFNVTLQTTIGKITNISTVATCHPLHSRSPQSPPSSHKTFRMKELFCHWSYGDNIVWIPTLSSPVLAYTK